MKTILDTIIEQKRKEVVSLKSNFTIKAFESLPNFKKESISLKEKLTKEFGVIAEFKRKSPSAGIIDNGIDPVKTAKMYEQFGASAISVLTDEFFFGAKESDILEIRKNVKLPILRKDFIIDEIQLFQAKAMGADVVLLIAEALSEQEIVHFTILAQGLGLEVICEFHEKNQLHKITDLVDVIGVNNRNLKNQTTSIQTSLEIIDFLPKDKVIITESGINTKKDLELLATVGFNGALIGESILRNESNSLFLSDLMMVSQTN
ncbi:MAG: indole-3-glycerol-phosphate synthase [Flavobacteriia bacterium]|nr:indole-3-glycerol-phosphate synthase [Flavobacteriia bacterium]